jgi:Lipid A 3-O-deacylase (PagL)
LTFLVDGKACFAQTLTNKRSRQKIFSLALLLATIAMFPFRTYAQQCGSKLPDITFDSKCTGGPSEPTVYDLSTDVRDLMTLSPDNIAGDTRTLPLENVPEEDSENQPSTQRLRKTKPPDFNREIYYRNKLEFGLDFGFLPINIPFPLDIFVGDNYNTYPLHYTLAPIFASLRWQIDGLEGPWILRGNWDMTFTGGVTLIPRGPESRYFAYIMGIRRNFVPRNSRIAPYFDIRLGVGNTDAQGPLGVAYAQGQDWTFTVNMGSGVRYNFSPRYAVSAGMHFMHMSNLDLSEHPWTPQNPTYGVRNYGINVYGPMVGIDIQLRKHKHSEP